MKYVKLGNTGLDVSNVCLGCMSFGDSKRGSRKWLLNNEESDKIIKHAINLGINFFDTANCYAYGTSEEILGKTLKQSAKRDEVVVATKVFVPMRPDKPNGGGLSRKVTMMEIDESLKRLGMDYVDLYIIHRWDYETPIEETMSALNDIVKMGKVRYIGASAMYAWQFQKAQYLAEKNGWSQFVSMQNHYNLLYREDEREMIPLCQDQKIALTPYSPLAAGRLARDGAEATRRSMAEQKYVNENDVFAKADNVVVERLAQIAEQYGFTRAQIALAWLYHKPQVISPVVGCTKMEHLEEAIKAASIKLTSETISYLEESYVPHKIDGPY